MQALLAAKTHRIPHVWSILKPHHLLLSHHQQMHVLNYANTHKHMHAEQLYVGLHKHF